jgi:hypothetical protein
MVAVTLMPVVAVMDMVMQVDGVAVLVRIEAELAFHLAEEMELARVMEMDKEYGNNIIRKE